MNHETARAFFMDYLYDEIEEKDRQQLEKYLQQHPELRTELQELQSTRTLLQQMPMAEPDRQLFMVEPKKRSFWKWLEDAKSLVPRSGFKRLGMAVAAGLVLFLFLGSAAQLHFDFSDSGFSMSMGYSPTVNQGLSPEQATELVNRMQEQNNALIAEYAEIIRQENQQQVQQVVQYFQQQRVNDLQLINQNLEEFYQANNHRWLQANEFIGEFLQNASYQDQNQ